MPCGTGSEGGPDAALPGTSPGSALRDRCHPSRFWNTSFATGMAENTFGQPA